LGFEQATEKPFSRLLIATVLHEDINSMAVLWASVLRENIVKGV
jgi:hypothetical protein